MAKKPTPVPSAQAAIDAAIDATKPAPEAAKQMPADLHRDFQMVAGAAGCAALPDREHQAWKDALNRIAMFVLSKV